ncbi:MAG: potassium efflux system protein [Paracoccaceae bacterium]
MFRAVLVWLLLSTAPLFAQDGSAIDYTVWETTAERAEGVVAAERASSAALEVLRSEIAGYRAAFLQAQDANAARLSTVTTQLAALGEVAADGTEDPELAARRASLLEQFRALTAPRTRAEEAFSRANGLISEIDVIIRDRQKADYLELGPSPLNPVYWPAGIEAGTGWVVDVYEDWRRISTSPAQVRLVASRLPAGLALTVLGLVVLFRYRRWTGRLRHFAAERASVAWRWMALLVASLLYLVLPMLATLFMALGATMVGSLAATTAPLVTAVVVMVGYILLSGWLALTIFPRHPVPPAFLALPESRNASARRAIWGMGLTLGLYELAALAVPVTSDGFAARAMLQYPVLVVGAVFTIRFGILLLAVGRVDVAASEPGKPPGAAEAAPYRDRMIVVIGRLMIGAAIVGAVAGAIGYFVFAQSIILQLIKTVGIFGVILVLNRIAREMYLAVTHARPLQAGTSDPASADAPSGPSAGEGLFPVLAGMVLVCLAVPVLALVWGARVADLTELWTGFLAGVSLGDTRISPAIFLTLMFVFLIGYALTRVIQGTLRNSVLPKTRIDIGGQTAIVSGIGYVGIFLAALVSITMAGIDLSSLAIVAGALSVGIGFGLQNIVSNFVSGIILLIERPVSEGDWIEVGGVMGTVRRISVRATRIETFDRTDVIVPNADLITSHVINWTKNNLTGRLIVPIGVAYGTDNRRIEKILMEIAEAHPMVILTPPPQVIFAGFGADSLNFEIRVILRNVNFILSTKSDMHHAIAERFKEEGIEIPFAQRDVWLRNPEALHPPAAPTGVRDNDQQERPHDPTTISK